MGVDPHTPLLPAPTDSTFHDTTGGSVTGTDLATDVSRRTDRTSYSIPDDGSPITISTSRRSQRGRDREGGKLSRTGHQSQTSLLIEYFEDGKKGSGLRSRPSVRVKVTPTSARKAREQNERIQISETGSVRKPSYTRRISLGTPTPARIKGPDDAGEEDLSLSSVASGTEELGTGRRPPVEIEFENQNSEVSAGYIQPASDISSMPPDSMLESTMSSRRYQGNSIGGEERHEVPQDDNLLKTPSRQRSRSLSRERIAQKAAEKLAATPRGVSHSKQRTESKGKQRSQSKEYLEPEFQKSPRRRSGKHRDSNDQPSPESSLLTNSALSSQNKAGDQYSFRSGTSRSSLNNPKLLDTVEDAIRRLILPELKELKKDQKVHANRTKFDKDVTASQASGSVVSKDDLGRRLSKHASAPDVTKHRQSTSGEKLGADYHQPPSSKKKDKNGGSRPARPSSRKFSADKSSDDDASLRRKRSKGLRDAEAARIVGSRLTAASLQHHDSQSSLDKQESKRRGSKGRSRSASINETEVVFGKHDVAPMPFRSEIDSELTRDSILSQQTETTVAPHHGEVARASIQQTESPAASPMHDSPNSNKEQQDRNIDLAEDTLSDQGFDEGGYYQEDPSFYADRELSYSEQPHGGYARRRTLSPIQSVASDRGDEDALDHEEATFRQSQTPTPNRKLSHENDYRFSIDSLSSAASTDMARSTRAATNSFEKDHHSPDRRGASDLELDDEGSPSHAQVQKWEQSRHEDEDDVYRRSLDEYGDSEAGMRRMTDDSDDGYDNDPFDAGENVQKGSAKVVDTPFGVESDVASLLEPSVVDRTSAHSTNNSATGPLHTRQSWSPRMSKEINGDTEPQVPGSPLKHRQDASSPVEQSFQKRMGVTSPPQSVAKSSSDDLTDQPRMGATGLPNAGSPIPEIGHIPDSEESEINTNPSIIQGPIGGLPQENRDHWPYGPTPPRQKGGAISPQSQFEETQQDDGHLGDRTVPGLGVSTVDHAGVDEPYYSPNYAEGYGFADKLDSGSAAQPIYENGYHSLTSPMKDEGYISGANHRSGSTITPEPQNKGLDMLNNIPEFGSPLDDEEPFNESSHKRHLSGYSHGMDSPLYDSATGRGIDRIQSKDIVALMDHLTVRDAQRNARDTEMLVTLVRSAAEMRNSFEDMKKFIAQQDELLMEANDKQHDKTQKAIGGPRPLPTGLPRAARQTSAEDDEDLRSKRKNVFKRALRGLTMKNSNDLTNIEDMLVQLLSEVEGLRTGQEGRSLGTDNEAGRSPMPESYRSQGQAGPGSSENQRGLSPNSQPSVKDGRILHTQRESGGRRISPVIEGDEELEPLTSNEQEVLNHQMETGQQLMGRHKRGGSVPLGTPERVPVATGAVSNDTTPKMSADKSRKHKSSSSSFFPKISRWSKTTASSMGDNIRNTMQPGRKDRPSSEMSRSGSDLQDMYAGIGYYDHRGDDRLRSNNSLENDKQDNRPPSPLVPSQVSENPRYQAHRDSFNLQHPQPRQGPTARYQNQLETEAQNFGPYTSPKSEAWTSNPSLSAAHPDAAMRHHSPVSDGGYSARSSTTGRQNGPPRPPKIRDEGPLVPQRPPQSTDGSQASYADRIAMREGVRPTASKVSNGTSRAPQRRPTGPRPYTSSGRYGSNQSGLPKRQQYRGSPAQIDHDADY